MFAFILYLAYVLMGHSEKLVLIRNITYSTLIFTSYKVTNFACTVDVTLTKGVLCVVVTNDIPPCNLKCFYFESRPIFWVAVIKSLNRLFLNPKKNIRIIFNLSFKSNRILKERISGRWIHEVSQNLYTLKKVFND